MTLPSHQLFIHPAGTLLNIRHAAWTRWAIAIVDHPLADLRHLQTGTRSGWLWSCLHNHLTRRKIAVVVDLSGLAL